MSISYNNYFVSFVDLNTSAAFPYDVNVTRRETEGFGFVIISSVTKSGTTVGEFIGTCRRAEGLFFPFLLH